jgi:hypothetical protein
MYQGVQEIFSQRDLSKSFRELIPCYLQLPKTGTFRKSAYNVDVLGGAPSANYASEHKKFSGLVIPTRRRVYRCRPYGRPILDSVIVAIDFHEIKVD